jgi:hypothetical protein
MTGGIIQLAAYGIEDLFITGTPQITFFKVVYRRHTNFSTEQIPQYFTNQQVNFGKKVSLTISKNGDLMSNINLIVTLPQINQIQSDAKFAWVRKVGFAMIKTVEIEINSNMIDRHYGEWLAIWAELTGATSKNYSKAFDKMIGNTPELTNFTSSKPQTTLYIPLQFWFCRAIGLALPIVSLQYCDIRLNVEFNNADTCYNIAPSHYIKCKGDIVNFLPYEYIEQKIGTKIFAGQFVSFDTITKNLYYLSLSNNLLAGVPTTEINKSKYSIIGLSSGFTIMPESIDLTTNTQLSKTYLYAKIPTLVLSGCFVLINFHYVDEEERHSFLTSKQEYLIEQLYYTPSVLMNNVNQNIKLNVNQPCKMLIWIKQLQYISDYAMDYFNYTDSFRHKYNISNLYTGEKGSIVDHAFVPDPNNYKHVTDNVLYSNLEPEQVVGDNLSVNESLLLNGRERISKRSYDYYAYVQQMQHFKNVTTSGINMYCFSLMPELIQPMGTCNMSQIETIEIQMQLKQLASSNGVYFRAYGLCLNILRISNGLASPVFIDGGIINKNI